MSASERHEFQAEVKQLLDLMVHSLYSDKDVFLRELISNASDALDKLRFERLTGAATAEANDTADLEIVLSADAAARTLSIADNGIGMTRDEVIKNIGTIAKSGTREFLAAAKAAPGKTVSPDLIGQFGVGFYAAFMVADRIELVTRKAHQAGATRWISTGDGAYTLEEAERDRPGTTITLHLKPADEEHGLKDYTSDRVVDAIVKHYSDFVAYPIKRGETTLNSMKAIWDRPKAEVTEDEYKEFYKHLSHDWNDPLRTIPVKIEGTLEAYALLYVPAKAPFDLFSPEMKRGVQLYVKRVFVMDECKELMPSYLRFVKGVVDAHDLSLNVSREILQKDRQIAVIRKQLVKKVLGTLDELKRDAREDYLGFWAGFGPALKEGLVAPEGAPDQDKLLDLVVAATTHAAGSPTTLAEYVGRMKDGQDTIYVLTGTSQEAVARSPLLEGFTAKGYEVLLFADPIDEIWLEREPSFQGKPLKSIGRGDVQPGTEDERKAAAAAVEDQRRELGDLLICLRAAIQDEVKEVRLSSRLTSSSACLVADEHDLTPRMQKLLEQLGQAPPPVRPVLELNPTHPVMAKLKAVFAADSTDPRLAASAKLLLGQAYLADTGQLPNPAAFGQALDEIMLRAM
ncbi:MAG: molecular chaperone HtpG [Myxococcales bacterium]|nr:molecular chaperone HtpG [Myxococcales bacterium]